MSRKRQNILVVDDYQNIRVSMETLLEDYFNVFSAVNAKQAQEILKEHKINLVFLDVSMPEKDGFDLLSEIKKEYSGLPVAMLTGHGSEDTVTRALNMGCVKYFKKPFDMYYLLREISEILGVKIEYKDTEITKRKEKAIRIVNQVTEIIKNKYFQKIRIEDIANEFDISVKYMNKIYREILGSTVKKYLNEHRIERAKEKLRKKDASVRTMYKEVGFGSNETFYRLFTKHTGVLPEEYKNQKF